MRRENTFVKLKEYLMERKPGFEKSELPGRPFIDDGAVVRCMLDPNREFVRRDRYINFSDVETAIESMVCGNASRWNPKTEEFDYTEPIIDKCYIIYFTDTNKQPLIVTKDSLDSVMEKTQALE